jgi:hypothetical protein
LFNTNFRSREHEGKGRKIICHNMNTLNISKFDENFNLIYLKNSSKIKKKLMPKCFIIKLLKVMKKRNTTEK